MVEAKWLKGFKKVGEYTVEAFENGIKAGNGTLCINDGNFLVKCVFVLKEFRGRGYGNLLLRMVIRKSFDMGAESVIVLLNFEEELFYEKLGFKKIGIENGNIKMICVDNVKGCCGYIK